MQITKIRGATNREIYDSIEAGLSKIGMTANLSTKTSSSVDVRNIRNKDSHNVRPYSEIAGYGKSRRTNALTWNEWIKVNNTINDVLDSYNASANVHSLGGKFRIRAGTKRYTPDDWKTLGNENVGSMVHPVSRKDWVLSAKDAEDEGYSFSKRKLNKMI